MIHRRAPAKLNLYLRVVGKRPDGYHEIETLFERIDLADELTFEPADDLQLTCNDPQISSGEDNLVIKAARALQQHAGTTQGAHIHLTKRIPIAAGLGGGSSDAATTLVGLNLLWKLQRDRSSLMELAGTLGSDIPFFLCDESPFAIGRGRGERCESFVPTGIQQLAHILVVPSERLSTKDVYTDGEFNLTASKPSITMLLHAFSNGSLSELAQGLWNDLEPEAIRRCPVIARIQASLHELGCLGIRVSGSGSAVFGLCRDSAHAQQLARELRQTADRSWQIHVAHTATAALASVHGSAA